MDLYVDPIWGVFKSALLEAVLVMTDVFALLEVEKPVPPSELVPVCWGYF